MAAELEPTDPGGELVSLGQARRLIAAAVAAHDTDALTELRRQAASYQTYYAHREAGRELANDAGEVKVRAERGLGHLDAEANPHGGPREQDVPSTSWSPEVSSHTRAAWRMLAALPDADFERHLAEAREDQESGVSTRRVLRPGPHQGRNSGDSEWYTRDTVIAAAVEVLGGIDLDPASTAEANEVVGAVTYYTEETNGLDPEQPWSGRVFLNPPYNSPWCGRFIQRLLDEYEGGSVRAAVVLVNNATETGWCQALARVASAVCWPSGRHCYWHPDPVKDASSPLQGQLVLYLGPYPGQFVEAFAPLGVASVWRPGGGGDG